MTKIIEKLISFIAVAIILAGVPLLVLSQQRPPATHAPPDVLIGVPKKGLYERPYVGERDTSEKSIKADSQIIVELCVNQGKVKVNGWNRAEARVYVSDGNKFVFNVREKSAKTGDPNWVKVIGSDTSKGMYPKGECISANEIDIDVPINATINLRGHEITTDIDSVRKVEIKIAGGQISLRNIANGITAYAGQGGITVEASTGPMLLDSTNGNIVIFEARPAELGDIFRAKTTGGTISLQGLEHRQVEASSISGSVVYGGQIRNGGSYSLTTNKGSIRMSLAINASFQMQATYRAGNFNSELPIKLQTENIQEGPIKTIVGKLGTGDASIKLTTNNGSISIRKL